MLLLSHIEVKQHEDCVTVQHHCNDPHDFYTARCMSGDAASAVASTVNALKYTGINDKAMGDILQILFRELPNPDFIV